MIYIYGSGGRSRLIKEILLRLKKKNKNIIFIDDLNKNYKSSKYLIKKFKNFKDQLFIGISDPKIQKFKYDFFKKKLKNIDNKPLIDPTVILKSDVKINTYKKWVHSYWNIKREQVIKKIQQQKHSKR